MAVNPDPDELQHMDELDTEWAEKWKKKVKKGPLRVWKGMRETVVETKHYVTTYVLKKPRKQSECGVWVDGERIGDADESNKETS